jgi:hypothetical protein
VAVAGRSVRCLCQPGAGALGMGAVATHNSICVVAASAVAASGSVARVFTLLDRGGPN